MPCAARTRGGFAAAVATAAATATALILLSAGCNHPIPAEPAPVSPAAAAAAAVKGFRIESFEAAAAEGTAASLQALRAKVVEALDRYLDEAVVGPLRSGRRAEADALADVFAGAAAARVRGPDRVALVDDGLPEVSGVTIDKATASVLLLVGRGPAIGMASVRIALSVRGMVGTIPLVIERTGELVLEPDGDTLKISGYDIRVSKDSVDSPTTTSATTSATTAATTAATTSVPAP